MIKTFVLSLFAFFTLSHGAQTFALDAQVTAELTRAREDIWRSLTTPYYMSMDSRDCRDNIATMTRSKAAADILSRMYGDELGLKEILNELAEFPRDRCDNGGMIWGNHASLLIRQTRELDLFFVKQSSPAATSWRSSKFGTEMLKLEQDLLKILHRHWPDRDTGELATALGIWQANADVLARLSPQPLIGEFLRAAGVLLVNGPALMPLDSEVSQHMRHKLQFNSRTLAYYPSMKHTLDVFRQIVGGLDTGRLCQLSLSGPLLPQTTKLSTTKRLAKPKAI